ncbi:MAG: hypothetical protein OER83_03405 [Flavobacteriaceae bacterium]|nr:hypothetical protein [Flavobacteriaceae bacterium]MDH3795899.1 hypothetical protein [Flavobacteriaceae bacterium]
MKAILTLILVLAFGAAAMAHSNITSDEKVKTNALDIVLDSSLDRSFIVKEVVNAGEKKIARVYRSKNSRVKKALSFTTKKSKPKLA